MSIQLQRKNIKQRLALQNECSIDDIRHIRHREKKHMQ